MKKRFFALLLALTLALSLLPVTAAAAKTTPPKSLKVLAIGNSYSTDATAYLYDIAKVNGVEEIVIGNLYIAGCALSTHWKNAQDNLDKYTYYKNDNGKWRNTKSVTMLSAILDEDWDFITFQQVSHNSGKPSTYSPLGNLASYVNQNKTNPDAKLVWHMTWSYQNGFTGKSQFASLYKSDQYYMYECIVNAVRSNVGSRSDISMVIPSGTAIQNARASELGDNLNRDGTHLNTIGRVIAAYTWYCTLTGDRPDALNYSKVPDSIGTSAKTTGIRLSTQELDCIQQAVSDALSSPYSNVKEFLDPHTLKITYAEATVEGQPVTSAVKGEEVTLTYNVPNKEFIFGSWSIVSNNVTLSDPNSTTTTFIMPDEDVTIEANYINTCPSQNMKDVSIFKWYHDAVDYVLTNGIMNGYSPEKFAPDESLSRAMVVQVLYNKEGKPAVTAENKFSDVPSDQWYFDAVRWAADKGVVSGYNNGCFDPEGKITIEQVVAILHNYAGKPTAEGDLSGVGKYDDWAAGALQWAVANDVLKNIPFTNATEYATRAQTAQMLMNYLNP